MTSLAERERLALADLAEELGPEAATLCEGWAVRDLLAHLVVREGSPAAVGIAVPPLSGLVDAATERTAGRDFDSLVGSLRDGPPWWSPLGWPVIGPRANLLEMVVHHEDVRRAQPGWAPRDLPGADQDQVWAALPLPARGLLASAPVGVSAVRTDTDRRRVLRRGDREVTLRGLPLEVALFVFGRGDQAKVEIEGDPDDVSALRGTSLGF